MKNLNYKINTKVNGNFTNIYVNFEDGTYGKVTLRSYQTRKGIRYNQIGEIEGNYNKSEWMVSVDEIFGAVNVVKCSSKKASVSEKLTHGVFGEVEVLSRNNNMITIKLSSGEEKTVLEKIFMNLVK